MATIVHRRPAPALGPEAPRGPGGSFDSLTWVGYASLVAAFGFLVFGLRPLTEMGDMRMWDLGNVFSIVAASVRNAAVVVLPAALEWGVPGARRVTPWLVRGTVLIALEPLLRAGLRLVQGWYIDLQPADVLYDQDPFGYDTPFGAAIWLVGLAISIVGAAGAWSLSDGLADAGGRVRRRVIVALVTVGTLAVLATYVPYFGYLEPGATIDFGSIVLWMSLVGLGIDLVDNAIWLMVAARLIAGFVAHARPRAAWGLGALAASGMFLIRLLGPVLTLWFPTGGYGYAFTAVSVLSWVLLVVAFLAGLGRGRVRRRPRPRRMRLFVLHPTS
ncbi:MAG TPA: hypothetical protein VES19_00130 [Candidatus Limnocylindrales bacterium]|nr:hypothetical protein [Candidatus Limnocylindrales bacterium]